MLFVEWETPSISLGFQAAGTVEVTRRTELHVVGATTHKELLWDVEGDDMLMKRHVFSTEELGR